MEFLIVAMVVAFIWWITARADRPTPRRMAVPPLESPVSEPTLSQTKTTLPLAFRKEQALLAAQQGRLARAQLLVIIDSAHNLGITVAEQEIFSSALRLKDPLIPRPVDPRRIKVSVRDSSSEELFDDWEGREEKRKEFEEALNDR